MSTVSSSVLSTAPAAAETAWWDTSEVQMPEEFLKYQAEVKESMLSLLTPLNFTILAIILTVVYLRARSSSSTAAHLDPTRPITFRTFTPRSLLRYDGTKNDLNPDSAVYLAVKGKVYDVSSGRNFYGPGGPYENFAGRDATRGLACQSFDEEMLTKNLDGPLDDVSDLGPEEVENLRGWVERFDEKYLIVGRLVPFNSKVSHF